MFDNEHLTYICGHYKRRASKTYDSRQHPRERSKTEILTTINPLLLFFSYLAALLDHTEKYPGTQYTRMDDLNINSFNALYTLYYRKSFLFAKSYVHDEQVAEDIAAEALIKLWEKLKTDIINSPQAMLLTILKNKSLDYLRLEQNKLNAMSELSELYVRELDIRVSSLEACDPSEIFSEEVNQIIQATLRTLPEQTRRVFKMSRFENKMNKEIAENLGITVKGVEYHISGALKEFRISLKDYLPLFYFFFYFH